MNIDKQTSNNLYQMLKEGKDRGMKKPQIRSIIPHFVQSEHPQALPDRIADLHAQVIESGLSRLDLTIEQKITVIDQIIATLKSNKIYDLTQ